MNVCFGEEGDHAVVSVNRTSLGDIAANTGAIHKGAKLRIGQIERARNKVSVGILGNGDSPFSVGKDRCHAVCRECLADSASGTNIMTEDKRLFSIYFETKFIKANDLKL